MDIIGRYELHQQHSSNDGPSIHECIAEIKKLRAALRVFVIPRDGRHAGARNDRDVVWSIDGYNLRVGDFVRARQLTQKSERDN